jgi:hypothetical protein
VENEMLDGCFDAPFVTFENDTVYRKFTREDSRNTINSLQYFGRTDDHELLYRNNFGSFVGIISSAEVSESIALGIIMPLFVHLGTSTFDGLMIDILGHEPGSNHE